MARLQVYLYPKTLPWLLHVGLYNKDHYLSGLPDNSIWQNKVSGGSGASAGAGTGPGKGAQTTDTDTADKNEAPKAEEVESC